MLEHGARAHEIEDLDLGERLSRQALHHFAHALPRRDAALVEEKAERTRSFRRELSLSNETGRAEVYVETFPSRRKQLVSAEGASKCWWREDAKELLYQEPSGRVLAVDVDADVAGVRLVFGEPTLMFEGPPVPADDVRGFFTGPAPFPDGSQFLLIKPAEEAIPAPLTLVVNWTAELETH